MYYLVHVPLYVGSGTTPPPLVASCCLPRQSLTRFPSSAGCLCHTICRHPQDRAIATSHEFHFLDQSGARVPVPNNVLRRRPLRALCRHARRPWWARKHARSTQGRRHHQALRNARGKCFVCPCTQSRGGKKMGHVEFVPGSTCERKNAAESKNRFRHWPTPLEGRRRRKDHLDGGKPPDC